MNLYEFKATRDALKAQLLLYERIKPSCRTCEKFSGGRCESFNATPPPDWVIGASECESWVYDGIPF